MKALSRRLDRLEGPKRLNIKVDERLRNIFNLNPDGTFSDHWSDELRGRHFHDVMTSERWAQLLRDINKKAMAQRAGDAGA